MARFTGFRLHYCPLGDWGLSVMLKVIALIFVSVAVLMYALCVNSGSISRQEERKELEEWIREHRK